MELLPVVCLCLLTRSGITSADGNEPVVVPVEQDGDALLPCSPHPKQNIEQGYFDWNKVAQNNEKRKEVFLYYKGRHSNNNYGSQSEQFKGRVFHFPEELKHGNASIIIRNTKMADNGEYTCTFATLEPRQTCHFKLVVGRVLKNRLDENIPGAAPKPNAENLHQTKDRALLQCEANGKPEPEVEWRDSAGNILPAEEPQVSERDGRFFITLNTTVTKTDRYRCVATQKNISHQIYAETFVHFNGPTDLSVYEGDAVTLSCSLSTKENIESEMFEWKKDGEEVFVYDAGKHYNGQLRQSEQFKGRVSHYPHKLKRGDASITIKNTKMSDSGNYTCDFPHLQPRQTFHFELEVVETGNSGSGASSNSSGSFTGLTVAVVILALVVIILAAVALKRHIPLKCNKGSATVKQEGSADHLNSKPNQSESQPDPET